MSWLRFAWSGTTRIPTALIVAFVLASMLEMIPDGGGSVAEANNWDGIRGVLFVALVVFVIRSIRLSFRE